MKIERVSINYAVSMTVDEFKIFKELDYINVVKPKLESLGNVTDIKHNRHLEPNIYFTATPDVSYDVTNAISNMIKEYKAKQEKYIPESGQVAMFRDNEGWEWRPGIFVCYYNDSDYRYECENDNYRFCRPLTSTEKGENE